MTTPIRRVARIQTGTCDLHVQHVEGSRWPSLLWIFFGSERLEGLPVSVFVVEHDEALILFDAGMSPTVATDPDYWPDPVTRTIMNKLFRLHIGPEDTLTRQLELAGYAAGGVDKAVLSHLHFDHVGGIAEIPQAELVVSREAWKHMLGPHPEREAVLRRDIELPGAKWTTVGFEPGLDQGDGSLEPFTNGHDLMGDGSIVLLPTPGHLAGSLSMFVRADPPLLFVGDLCYSVESMMRGQFPGTGERTELAESWKKVRALAARLPELVIVPSHDPRAVAEFERHPLSLAASAVEARA